MYVFTVTMFNAREYCDILTLNMAQFDSKLNVLNQSLVMRAFHETNTVQ